MLLILLLITLLIENGEFSIFNAIILVLNMRMFSLIFIFFLPFWPRRHVGELQTYSLKSAKLLWKYFDRTTAGGAAGAEVKISSLPPKADILPRGCCLSLK
jgi:hypothetical protein